jgi:branched-chain amino acid transport system permease protein
MLGGYYALISVGLALNFGVMRLVNLSHGDWLIVAAYLCAALLAAGAVSPFWALAGGGARDVRHWATRCSAGC